MKTYNEMKDKVFAKATRPEGYFGKKTVIGFALHEGKIIEVADCGYYTCPCVPCANSQEEIIWLVNNHPLFKDYKIIA